MDNIVPINQLMEGEASTASTSNKSSGSSDNIVSIQELMGSDSSNGKNTIDQAVDSYQEGLQEWEDPVKDNLFRMKLGFAGTDEDKKNLLRTRYQRVEQTPDGKFMVGNSATSMQPLDPDNIFDGMIQTLSNNVAEIPAIAGTILGATTGGIPGAGVGAAAGTFSKQEIGKAWGINHQKALDRAADVVINGMFGSIGEGIGKAITPAPGKIVSGVATKALDDAFRAAPEPSVYAKGLAKILRFEPGIPEQETLTAMAHGFKNTWNPKYLNTAHSSEIMEDLAKGVINTERDLGKAVGAGKKWLQSVYGGAKPDIEAIQYQYLDLLKQSGVLNPDVTSKKLINEQVVKDPAARKHFESVLRNFFDVESWNKKGGFFDVTPRAKMQLGDIDKFGPDYRKGVLSSLDELSRLGKSFYDSTSIPEDLKRINAGFVSEVKNKIATSLPQKSNPWVDANTKYYKWKDSLRTLAASGGPDLTNVSYLDHTLHPSGVINQDMERFVKNYSKMSDSTKRAFSTIVPSLRTTKDYSQAGFQGGKGTILNEILKYNSAQSLINLNPSILRTGFVAGIIAGPMSPLVKGITAIALSSPSIVARGAVAASRTGEFAGNIVRPVVKPMINAGSQLLAKKVNQRR